jgi:hypothetical protein
MAGRQVLHPRTFPLASCIRSHIRSSTTCCAIALRFFQRLSLFFPLLQALLCAQARTRWRSPKTKESSSARAQTSRRCIWRSTTTIRKETPTPLTLQASRPSSRPPPATSSAYPALCHYLCTPLALMVWLPVHCELSARHDALAFLESYY